MIKFGPGGAKVCSHGWSVVEPVERMCRFHFCPRGAGESAMPDLWGVDDEKEVRRIELLAEKRTRFTKNFWIGALLFGIIGESTTCLLEMIDVRPSWIRHMIGAFVGAVFLGIWARRIRRPYFPSILEEGGRCTKCGYNLKNNSGGACPECGETVLIDASKSDLTPRPQIR